jgi:phage I-like protein
MSRKVKIISILVAAVMLTLGIVSVAFAQAPPTTTPPQQGKTLLARVAEIIGGTVTEQKLTDAFKQATAEIRNQNIDRALQKAVENGRITQQQSDEIKAWWQQRPAALDSLMGGFLRMPGLRGQVRGVPAKPLPVVKAQLTRVAEILVIPEETLVNAFKKASQEMKLEAFNRALDKAVANGRLTQEQAEKIRERVGEKPGAVPWFKGRIQRGMRGWGWR